MKFNPLKSASLAVAIGCVTFGCNYQPSQINTPSILAAKAIKGALPYDKPQEAQDFFVQQRAAVGTDSIDYTQYEAALNNLNLMNPVDLSSATAGRGTVEDWSQVGPGNIGGRTRQLVIDPNSPDTMYAAAVAGGVWKTTDAGASWIPVFDAQANIAVASLVMDPNNSDILYAGTGEGFFNADSVRGAGIFKTVNGGDNWFRLNNTDTSDFFFVNDLVVSPGDSEVIYAATRTGVFQSTDAGTNWSLVLDPTPITRGCLDLEIKSDITSDFIFASCGSFEQASIFRNTDAANAPNNWTVSYTDVNMARTSLALAPSNEDVIYALASSIQDNNFNRGLYAVLKSEDSGATWNIQVDNTSTDRPSTLLLSNPIIAAFEECGFGGPGSNRFFNQGWYDNILRVDPVNENRVWSGGIDLFRSDDGGQTWGAASVWFLDPTTDNYAHADNHGLVFHPDYDGVNNTSLFATGDGGVFRTDNPNDSVASTAVAAPDFPLCPNATFTGNDFIDVSWTGLNNGYEVTQFYNGTVYPNGDEYFGGTQDNGTIRGNDSTNIIWEEILGGDGGYVAVNPSDTNIIYAENTGISIQKSVDGGATFAGATTGITDAGGLFINPFIMDPNNPSRLWTSGNSTWRTDNDANNWTQASAAFPVGVNGAANGTAMAVAPDGNRVLFGADNRGDVNGIFINADPDNSDSSTVLPFSTPRAGTVSSLTFKPDDSNVIFATYSNFDGGAHVWKSVDGGENWAPSDGSGIFSVPNVPVHSMAFDPLNTDVIYLGTDIGILVSTDGGANWFDGNQGTMPRTPVEGLLYIESPTFSGVYAFTHGRSTFRLSVRDPIVDLIFENGFENLAP